MQIAASLFFENPREKRHSKGIWLRSDRQRRDGHGRGRYISDTGVALRTEDRIGDVVRLCVSGYVLERSCNSFPSTCKCVVVAEGL